MSGFGINFQNRAVNFRFEQILLGARKNIFLLAPQNQRRRFDFAERRFVVFCYYASQRRLPDARRQLQTLFDDAVDKLVRQRLRAGADLKIAGEIRVDRVFQIINRLL
jgi:hypothetical protein